MVDKGVPGTYIRLSSYLVRGKLMNGVVRLVPLGIAVFLLLLNGCGGGSQRDKASVTVAVEGDISSFNPLFTEEIISGEINDLLFPRLINPEFDAASGTLQFKPFLARSWDFSPDRRVITFHLNTSYRWSDQVPVTAHDVRLSFELYGDTTVASVRQSVVQNFRKVNGRVDVAASVDAQSDSTVVFHFERAYAGQLFDVGVPLLPAHIFGRIPRRDLRTHAIARSPVTAGPFALSRVTPMQEVVLMPGETTPVTPHLSRLVFKILPEYRSRVEQLKAGEVDIVTGLRLEEAKLPSENTNLRIISTVGRDYDFLGWNNIDPAAYAASGGNIVIPHKLFGSPDVRKALTMSIDREEIVKAYLGEHGQVAFGGVSPLFKWAYNDTLRPLPFDKTRATEMLRKEGWRDSDGNGVLDKQGVEFSFTLKLAGGNQLRDLIATIIQQQLRDVKIDMKIEQVDRSTFWGDLMQRKYDAWFAGFSVPLQMQLDELWGSDLRRYPFNLAGFQNKRVDAILAEARNLQNDSDGANLWKEFQVIVQREQPYTFLFWINNIVGVNARLQGTQIGILGVTHNAWDWHVNGSVNQ